MRADLGMRRAPAAAADDPGFVLLVDERRARRATRADLRTETRSNFGIVRRGDAPLVGITV
jgi:hypothetical protein